MVAGAQYASILAKFISGYDSVTQKKKYSTAHIIQALTSAAKPGIFRRQGRLVYAALFAGYYSHQDLVRQLAYSLTIILHYAYPINCAVHIRDTEAHSRPLEPLNLCGGSEERGCEVHEVSRIY